jgi:hypothetical protein
MRHRCPCEHQHGIEEGTKQVRTLWRADVRESSLPVSFTENGTDPIFVTCLAG